MRAFLRRLIARLTKMRGPIAAGEKFVTLDEKYLSQFDEIVVIGDIHGCCDEFEQLLHRVHSESPTKKASKCLKIIVGDLVNKGPKSEKVLELCRDHYPDSIIAVRGNHDEVVLRNYREKNFKEQKNKWIKRLPARYIDYLTKLPYTISIPSLNCVIVHAGLNPELEEPWKTTPTEDMVRMRNIVVEKDAKTNDPHYRCTKSIDEGAPWATFWPGPEHVYFGHDARRRLQADHEFATGLDTGCVYGDRLSYVYIKGSRKGEILSIKAKQQYQPVDE